MQRASPTRRSTRRRLKPYFIQLRRFVAADVEARGQLPDLSPEQVLAWADTHFARTGPWPTLDSGEILRSDGEDWLGVEAALMLGLRGFPGKDTLCRFLHRHRGKRNLAELPPLTESQILRWADRHHRRTGAWPLRTSGAIAETGETWSGVEAALHVGCRGLPGGSSLARLLAAHRGVQNRMALPSLSEDQILAWADAHCRRTGAWPNHHSGCIADAPGETWAAVESALRKGLRGLPGGSSLAQLLAEKRAKRNPGALPPLTEEQILHWADRHHRCTGDWPQRTSGPIAGTEESWSGINVALHQGLRGLPGHSSLARLLAEYRGVRNRKALPSLSEDQILAWADAHFRRMGSWPNHQSGCIADAPGETWSAVDSALRSSLRGLPGTSSLACLLMEKRRVRKCNHLPPLQIAQILTWADAYHKRMGEWPMRASGPIPEVPGETWATIDKALRAGRRGLSGGSSLARLLSARRGVRNRKGLPHLSEDQILAWADAHFRRTAAWPATESGAIPEAAGETWSAVGSALWAGLRGLPGGSSLARLLEVERGKRHLFHQRRLTERLVLRWARRHRQRTGQWPNSRSGPVTDAPEENWRNLDAALRAGHRGLPGGSSLRDLLARWEAGPPKPGHKR